MLPAEHQTKHAFIAKYQHISNSTNGTYSLL